MVVVFDSTKNLWYWNSSHGTIYCLAEILIEPKKIIGVNKLPGRYHIEGLVDVMRQPDHQKKDARRRSDSACLQPCSHGESCNHNCCTVQPHRQNKTRRPPPHCKSRTAISSFEKLSFFLKCSFELVVCIYIISKKLR